MDTSRLGPRDSRSPSRVAVNPHSALKSDSTRNNEDGVGQVKRDGERLAEAVHAYRGGRMVAKRRWRI